jgi:hypothetical protein
MSTVKTDAIVAVSTNGDLSLDGLGTGGVSIASTLKMTKGGDISSASPLVIDVDGNYFDVTGTTNFAAMTVESGNFFMLQFDGALTITHGSGIELPGAANLTTATGDRLICYATAADTVEVMSVETEAAAAGGGWTFVETETASSDQTLTFSHTVEAGYDYEIACRFVENLADIASATPAVVQVGTGGGPTFQTSGYVNQYIEGKATGIITGANRTTAGLDLFASEAMGGASADEEWSSRMSILNPGAAEPTYSFNDTFGDNDAGQGVNIVGRGKYDAATAITGLRVTVIQSTNFTTGEFYLFRRVIS